MWPLQIQLHSAAAARLQAGKRLAKTKEQFAAQVGGWCCSRQQGCIITEKALTKAFSMLKAATIAFTFNEIGTPTQKP